MSISRDAEDIFSSVPTLGIYKKCLPYCFQEGEHGPALRFMSRRNPHNPGGGEMRLYLRLQVEERALKVWGSEVRYATSCFFWCRNSISSKLSGFNLSKRTVVKLFNSCLLTYCRLPGTGYRYGTGCYVPAPTASFFSNSFRQ
jgi:hypothetical protein